MKLLSENSHEPSVRNHKNTLLIGSSMVRSIGSKDKSPVDVQSYSGASVDDLTKHLDKNSLTYKRIIKFLSYE